MVPEPGKGVNSDTNSVKKTNKRKAEYKQTQICNLHT